MVTIVCKQCDRIINCVYLPDSQNLICGGCQKDEYMINKLYCDTDMPNSESEIIERHIHETRKKLSAAMNKLDSIKDFVNSYYGTKEQ